MIHVGRSQLPGDLLCHRIRGSTIRLSIFFPPYTKAVPGAFWAAATFPWSVGGRAPTDLDPTRFTLLKSAPCAFCWTAIISLAAVGYAGPFLLLLILLYPHRRLNQSDFRKLAAGDSPWSGNWKADISRWRNPRNSCLKRFLLFFSLLLPLTFYASGWPTN